MLRNIFLGLLLFMLLDYTVNIKNYVLKSIDGFVGFFIAALAFIVLLAMYVEFILRDQDKKDDRAFGDKTIYVKGIVPFLTVAVILSMTYII
ncbi:hypothetical protein [Natranaerobius thermophilus]|nr:hypothetical protein [Natranaerobius thermophilus]